MASLRFWNVRSKWDYFSFLAVVQWCLGGLALVALGIGTVVPDVAIVGGLLLVAAMFINATTPLVVFSTWRGAKHHEHLAPSRLYHVAAVFFGPIVGVHYLRRTASTNATADAA